MEAREKHFRQKEFVQLYLEQINWDWLFLKAQMIFGSIIVLGILAFLLWFL